VAAPERVETAGFLLSNLVRAEIRKAHRFDSCPIKGQGDPADAHQDSPSRDVGDLSFSAGFQVSVSYKRMPEPHSLPYMKSLPPIVCHDFPFWGVLR
jgi:hypothetical protein